MNGRPVQNTKLKTTVAVAVVAVQAVVERAILTRFRPPINVIVGLEVGVGVGFDYGGFVILCRGVNCEVVMLNPPDVGQLGQPLWPLPAFR